MYCFAQYPGWAIFIQTISKEGNSGWAMPTQIIFRVGTCPPSPPSAGAHGLYLFRQVYNNNIQTENHKKH